MYDEVARYHDAYYFLVFAAVLIAPSFAFAWGPKGHQIVATLLKHI